MGQMRVTRIGQAACLAVGMGTVAAGLAAQDVRNPFTSDAIESLVYGVYCADPPVELEDAPETAAGVVNIVPTLPEMRAETTVVPARIGVGFGVLATARDGDVLDPVRVTITHPPYADSGIEVERWVTSIDGEGPSLVGFSFETEGELVAGPWTFEADHEGELLFRVAFEVVPAAMVPDLAQCGGAFLS